MTDKKFDFVIERRKCDPEKQKLTHARAAAALCEEENARLRAENAELKKTVGEFYKDTRVDPGTGELVWMKST